MPGESQEVGLAQSDSKELLKGALDSHQTITLRALDVIPAPLRLAVYILWTLSLLAALTAIVFLFAGSATFGFVIVLVAFICITVAVILQNRPAETSSAQLGEWTRGQIRDPSWARVVPRAPISSSAKLDEFQLSLRQIRKRAVAELNDTRKKRNAVVIDDDKIRINVFLLNTHDVAESGALVLMIPRQLQDNMSQFKDRDIRILPHEGLTGRTFTLGEPCGAKATLEGEKLIWEKADLFPERASRDDWEGLPLSDEQKALVGSRLRWIVSFPLKYDQQERDKPFAVLNIDGMDDELTLDDMQSLARSIEPAIKIFANSFAVLPKVWITIRVDDFLDRS